MTVVYVISLIFGQGAVGAILRRLLKQLLTAHRESRNDIRLLRDGLLELADSMGIHGTAIWHLRAARDADERRTTA